MRDSQRILFLADINSIHTERWVRNLVKHGYRIGIFSLSAKVNSWVDEIEEVEFECYGLGNDLVRSGKKWGKTRYFAAKKEARSFCDSFQPDIVHAHYASSYGMLAMRLKFSKTVLSLWGSDVYEFPKRSFIHRALFKKVLKSIPTVCSTSLDMAREASLYVKKDFKITPFGVNTDVFKPLDRKRNDDELVIGTVKSLEHVYGIDRLLQLFKQFSEKYGRPTRLLIYGKGSQHVELKQLANNLRISHLVEFKGFVEGEELVEAFNSLDIFVALSRRESFGVAALEAQACGVPVLVSDVGGLPEVVGPNSGMVIKGEDYESGYLALLDLAKVEEREELGRAARVFVEEQYSERSCTQNLMEVYDQL